MPTIIGQPLNILVINIHSTHNAGDAALAEAALQQLRLHFPTSNIVLAVNDPDSFPPSEGTIGSFFHWVKPVLPDRSSPWRLGALIRLVVCSFFSAALYRVTGKRIVLGLPAEQKRLLLAYMNADLVVSKPGNILISSGKVGLAFLLNAYLMWYASLLKKPAYLFPVSIGPLNRGWERWIAGHLLNRTRMVMVREELSLRTIQAAGVHHHPRCYVLPDTAFALDVSPHQQEGSVLFSSRGLDPEQNRPLIGVTAITWSTQNIRFTDQDRYETGISEVLCTFYRKHGGRIILFPQVTGPSLAEDDRVAARRIAAHLRENQVPVTLIEDPAPPGDLKAAYGHLDILIGTRLHSVIFALTEGVPSLAIGYLHKTRGLMRMAGLEDYMLDIENIQVDQLAQVLEKLWSERSAVRTRIRSKIPWMVDNARQAGELIATDYRSLMGI